MKKKKLEIVGFIPNEGPSDNIALKVDTDDSDDVSQYITSLVSGKKIQKIQILEGNLNSLIIGIPINLRLNFTDDTYLDIQLRFETSSLWSRMSVFFNYNEGDILSQRPMTYYRKKIPFYQRMITILKDKFDF
ncbi:hypothetical protein [Leptospira interrogans]|uniref:hypothetical protein n=1 Tax=Leptospira interrogans TaxID=173 RepID=UPI0002BEEEED|nr:hypothetical protein [Leptospira interrogans]EMN80286.1 hypothetical protein LEP1GSC106_2550 [Leptospira interrogans serovar Grippotyphosa str. UI 12764]